MDDPSSQYSVGPVQYHVHDGTDSPLISPNNLRAGTNIVIGSSNPITISSTGSGGVTQLIAGTNIILSPVGGTGAVTISVRNTDIAAIFRNSTVTATLSGGTSFTVAQTIGPNNATLIIGIEGHLVASDIITSVTYNGTSMPRLNQAINVGGESLWCYYLLNPITGTSNIVITTSSDPAAGGGGLYLVSVAYGNVFQGGFPEASVLLTTASGTSLAYSNSLSTANPYQWGVVVNGSSSSSLSMQSASGNGSANNIFASGTFCVISDTNGSINPPTFLTKGIQSIGTSVLMALEILLDPAP
jgi:hypothetical protein